MYKYIRELHSIFNKKVSCPAEERELASVVEELRGCLDSDEKKLLLRIIDLRDTIEYETSLESFASGMRLAARLGCELSGEEQISPNRQNEW